MGEDKGSTRLDDLRAWLEQPGVSDRFEAAVLLRQLEGVPDSRTVARTRAHLLRLFRRASEPLRINGWQIRASSIVRRSAEGNWAWVQVETDAWATPLNFIMTAGATSRYLSAVLGQADPDKPPSRHSPVHLSLLAPYGFAFTPDRAAPAPPPLELPWQSSESSGVVLTPATAGGWFRTTLSMLADELRKCSDDLAMRDRLIATANEFNDESLRYAALLTRHLGRDRELPEILERASAARDALDQSSLAAGLSPEPRDRSRQLVDWSHRRFVRFLDTAPR